MFILFGRIRIGFIEEILCDLWFECGDGICMVEKDKGVFKLDNAYM